MTHETSDASGRIAGLFVYPVKSCAGVALPEAILTETGLEFDRAWMVVDAQGEYLSQRELPRMALVQPKLRFSDMVLRAPGMLALHVALDAVEQPMRVRIWDDEVDAYDMGDIAAQWFTDFLVNSPEAKDERAQGRGLAAGSSLRLVRFDPDARRLSSLKWTGGVEALNQFNDGFQLLVVSQASLAGLNERLAAQGQPPVGMERFRPNIVLEGLQAHDEDRLEFIDIKVGDAKVRLKPVKPCARCPMVDVDPSNALTGTAVRDALQTYRSDARVDGAVTFGMNAIVIEGLDETLRTGQELSANFAFDEPGVGGS